MSRCFGEISYSRSESLWLARGEGGAARFAAAALWQVLPKDVRLSPHVPATNLQGPWWIPAGGAGAGRTRCCRLRRPHTGADGGVDGFGDAGFHRVLGDVAGAVTG